MDRKAINEYINILNTIKTTNAKLKVLRKRSKELDKRISDQMLRNNLQVINLSEGGSIEKKKGTKKQPIKKDIIVEKIRQKLDNSQAERLIESLYENRPLLPTEKIHFSSNK